jgi:hypothetical protein
LVVLAALVHCTSAYATGKNASQSHSICSIAPDRNPGYYFKILGVA